MGTSLWQPHLLKKGGATCVVAIWCISGLQGLKGHLKQVTVSPAPKMIQSQKKRRNMAVPLPVPSDTKIRLTDKQL